jgi:hypothetical protein
VIPPDLDGWSIIALTASYGDVIAEGANIFRLSVLNPTGGLAGFLDYTHEDPNTPGLVEKTVVVVPVTFIEVLQQYTIYLEEKTINDVTFAGYTITLTLENLP